MCTWAGAAAELNFSVWLCSFQPDSFLSLTNPVSINKALPGPTPSCSFCLMRPKERTTAESDWLIDRTGHWALQVSMLVRVSAAPEIDEVAVMQLAEMGFPLEACRKAVYYTGNMGPEMAFNWIIAHMEEPGEETSLHSGEQSLWAICFHIRFMENTAAEREKENVPNFSIVKIWCVFGWRCSLQYILSNNRLLLYLQGFGCISCSLLHSQ